MSEMSLNGLLNSVRNYLSSQQMLVHDEWLSGCIEYLIEDTNNSYSESEIKTLAKEQWLLNDLKDICPGSLPANLRCQYKTILSGRYVLQINSAIDIGTPAYEQYLKLKKVNTENIEATVRNDEKISSHRMIKLLMTDGAQDVAGIEYKPMRNLRCDLVPGCKVLVKGPVESRRGMLLLNETSIELLGGEVQENAEANSLASILARTLDLPIPQSADIISSSSSIKSTVIPTTHSELSMSVNKNDLHTTQGTSFEDPSVSIHRQTNAIFDQNFNQFSRYSNSSMNNINNPVARITSVQVADNFMEEEIDFDELAAIEAQITENPGKRQLDMDNPKPEKKLKIDHIVKNQSDEYPEDGDLLFEDIDHLKEMEAKFDASERKELSNWPICISAEPFVYIKQINDMKEIDKAGRVFNVKGQIIKLLSKLTVNKDAWCLKCTIIDGTGSIDVEFTSEVLSKLIGFTPQEVNDLRKQIATKPESKEKLSSALQKAKGALQVLCCIIELTMLQVPTITCVTPFNESHLYKLRKRLEDSCL